MKKYYCKVDVFSCSKNVAKCHMSTSPLYAKVLAKESLKGPLRQVRKTKLRDILTTRCKMVKLIARRFEFLT